MLRSMYSAISGLRTHQFKMDVIGNNIANVNTVGFKKSQVSFAEVFSQTTRGASAPQGGKGGTNPQQVGLGVNVSSVRVIHGGSSTQRTDNPLDFSISGEGFFMVSGDTGFNNRLYTRAGNFDLDRDGTIVTAEGLKVLGYKVDKDGKLMDGIGDIKINKSETVAPSTSTGIEFKGNLDFRVPIYDKDGTTLLPEEKRSFFTDTNIYDSLGSPYTVNYKVIRESDSWKISIDSIKNSNGDSMIGDNKFKIDGGPVVLKFGDDGALLKDDGIDLQNLKITNADTKIKIGDKDGNIAIDFSKVTQYGNDTTCKAYKKDGNTSGTIESFTISTSGEVIGVFTNGEKKLLGQVALAKFDNPAGLQKQGSNLFLDTRNSGEPQVGKADGSGYGAILGGTVEMSNVDLSTEFTEMITTQRGFQANSRVITTSDEILQELVNLKR